MNNKDFEMIGNNYSIMYGTAKVLQVIANIKLCYIVTANKTNVMIQPPIISIVLQLINTQYSLTLTLFMKQMMSCRQMALMIMKLKP